MGRNDYQRVEMDPLVQSDRFKIPEDFPEGDVPAGVPAAAPQSWFGRIWASEKNRRVLLIVGLLVAVYVGVTVGATYVNPSSEDLDNHNVDVQAGEAGSSIFADDPHTKVIFVKTHKTASSTVTAILFRFAFSHSLRMYMPEKFEEPLPIPQDQEDHKYVAEPGWKGNSPVKVDPYFMIPPHRIELKRNEEPYDVWGLHTLYNRPWLESIVPNGDVITSVRDPVSRFVSWWYYARLDQVTGCSSISEYVDAVSVGNRCSKPGLNPHIPLDEHLDMMTKELTEYRTERFEAILDEIRTGRIFQVIITEVFDESVVILQDRFRWNITDVLYFPLKDHSGTYPQPSEVIKERLRALHPMDQQLYDLSLQKHYDLKAATPDFDRQLSRFYREQTSMQEYCNVHKTERNCVFLEMDTGPLIQAYYDGMMG